VQCPAFRFQIAMKPQKQAFLAQISPPFLTTLHRTAEARVSDGHLTMAQDKSGMNPLWFGLIRPRC
jgi:hypothetical protein